MDSRLESWFSPHLLEEMSNYLLEFISELVHFWSGGKFVQLTLWALDGAQKGWSNRRRFRYLVRMIYSVFPHCRSYAIESQMIQVIVGVQNYEMTSFKFFKNI